MAALPAFEVFDAELGRHQPAVPPEKAHRVLVEKAGVAHPEEAVEIGVLDTVVLRPMLFPGLDKMAARREFAAIVMVTRRVVPAELWIPGY